MRVASRPGRGAEPPARLGAKPTGRQSALIAVGQGAIMLSGAALALLIAQFFGKTTETDAFFAGYGLYTVGLVLSQTFRLSAVSRLVADPGARASTELLAAAAVMALVAGIPMVALAEPLGRALVDVDPTGAAPAALRVLWIALAGQLVGAMMATMLAVRGAFTAIGVATLATSVVSLAVFVVLHGPLGIQGASWALATSGTFLMVVLLAVLRRDGWRPARASRALARSVVAEAGRMSYASLTFIGANTAYVVCLGLASRQGHGEVTLFSYAFVLCVALVGVTANVSAAIRSPAVLASDDRAGEGLAVSEWSLRFTLLLGGAGLALLLLVGPPVMRVVLGSDFDADDTRSIAVTAACLAGWVLGSAAAIFAVVELLARGQLRRLALLAVANVLGVGVLGWAGGRLAGIEGIAVAMSAVTLAVSFTQLRWAFPLGWRASVGRMARLTLRELAAVAAASAAPAAVLLATRSSTAGVVVAGVLAAAGLLVATRVAWPEEFGSLIAVVAPRR
jgi:O-antigen/teichoic acid export membrane protein